MSRTNSQAKIVSEEQLVPSANTLVIKKNNKRVTLDSHITDTMLRFFIEILRHHKPPRNQGNRNRDAPRRNAPVDTSTINALVVQDGIGGYDWSFQTEEGITNFALMPIPSKYDQQREALNKSNLEIIGYQIGLESLEARIVVHEKNEAVYEEDIAFLKYDVQNLTKLINSQITTKDKAGLGFDEQVNESEVLDNVFDSHESDGDDNPVNDRFKKVEGYHAVPPPYTGNYMPSRPDLSFAGLDDSVYKTKRVNHQNKLTHPHPKRNFVPTAVATKSRQVPVNVAKQISPRAVASISTARPVNTVAPKSKVNDALPTTYSYFKAHSPVKRAFNQKSVAKTNNFTEKVNTARVNKVTTVTPKAIVSVAVGNGENAIKSSACWIWRLTGNVIDHTSKDSGSYMLKRFDYVDLQGRLNSGEMKGIRGNLVLCQNLAYKIELLKEEETLIRVLVTMPHNNTSYELLHGRPPSISFMRPFGCHVTILNTLDPLGKFDEKVDEGFFVGYSINSKAFRVFNTRTRKVEENLHITFLENKPNVAGSGPDWLFDIYLLINSMNYEPVTAGNQTNRNASIKDNVDAGERNGQEKEVGASNKEGNHNVQDLRAELDNLLVQQKQADSLMPDLEDTTDLLNTSIFSGAYDDEDEGAEADLNNLETTMNVSPIPTTRIHKDHPKDQIIGDINLATQKRRMTKISKEHALDRAISPDKVYKVEKALYGLHQAPRAWYETLSTYLLENGFKRGTIDKTLFIKKDKGDILLVQVYVDDIIFGSTKKSLCVEFEQMMHKRFLMSSMGELTFFLRLQVKQKDDGIFISQDKYVVDILKKFDFATVKTASTPIETNKALLKDEEAEDVDVHLYRSMIGSLMCLIASRPDIMFVVCACARFQITPKDSHLHVVKRIFRYLKGQCKLGLWYPIDSPFDLEAFFDSDMLELALTVNPQQEVVWIQNQMLNYGFNFMNTKIHIDNESTICMVKNLVFYAKTKHIEIMHHFIRDSYEKRCIQVIKIHTDHNVTDLLTKAFDVSSISNEFGVKTGGCKVRTARRKLVLLSQRSLLEKSEGNADFHEIVDFLTVSSVRYTLIVSPTIYASYIEQFWNTAHSQTFNDVNQIHHVDGNTSSKIKSSVRSDLHFNDEDAKLCLVRMDDRVVRATTTVASLDAAQASGNITKTRSTAISNEPLSQEISSGGNTPGSDEERLEQDDLTDFIPPAPYDSPLSVGHTPGSDEGRPNINELMAICINLSNMVLALEQSKTAQDLVIQKLKKKVKRLEKKQRARTPGMKLFKIGTSKRKSLDKEYVSKQGRKSDKTKPMFDDCTLPELDVDNAMENVEGDAKTQGRNTAKQITTAGDTINTASIDVSAAGPLNVSTADFSISTARDIFKDEMMTIADTLVAIRSTRPRTTSVVIHDVKEEPRRATSVPIVQSQDKGKGKMVEPKPTLKNPIQRDKELATRLHEEDKAELERMQSERATQEEASNAALIAKFDNVQARIKAEALLAARLQEKEREQFSIDKQARFLVETIAERKSSKKRPRAELDEESVKRQKIGEASGSGEEQSSENKKELSEEELQKLLVVVPVEEVYVEALQKVHYNQEEKKEPTDDKEKELLYDTCGVHHVSSVKGHDIFILVKKEYPLTRGTLGLMMVARLLVEADSEMSRELLRKIFYQANIPRQKIHMTASGYACDAYGTVIAYGIVIASGSCPLCGVDVKGELLSLLGAALYVEWMTKMCTTFSYLVLVICRCGGRRSSCQEYTKFVGFRLTQQAVDAMNKRRSSKYQHDEGTKKQQTYKLIIGSIDVNDAHYVLVLPMAVNTASLIFEGEMITSQLQGKLWLYDD
ncbi:uncharacterized mitochondrial protein-like protein, partial [Tanacetum coccineum]